MKGVAAAFLAGLVAVPACSMTFVLDGTHGREVRLSNFGEEIPFDMQLLGGPPAQFTVSAFGLAYGDPRGCSQADPENLPPDCTMPIDPVFGEDTFNADSFSAEQTELWMPFFGYAIDGRMTFSATTGSRVLITIDAAPAPEPTTWVTMLAGFAAIGTTLRRKGNVWSA